jgi:hypothetical protein
LRQQQRKITHVAGKLERCVERRQGLLCIALGAVNAGFENKAPCQVQKGEKPDRVTVVKVCQLEQLVHWRRRECGNPPCLVHEGTERRKGFPGALHVFPQVSAHVFIHDLARRSKQRVWLQPEDKCSSAFFGGAVEKHGAGGTH